MTVYVDDMYLYPMGQFGRMKMSHMIADSDDELHAMADRIGIARRWFQDKFSGPHYDIAKSKRALAVQFGAVEITWAQCAQMSRVRRLTKANHLVRPDLAQGILRHVEEEATEVRRRGGV